MRNKDENIRPLGIPIRLADSKKGPTGEVPETSDIQILKAGLFSHPWYGEFQLTTELFNNMIQNFNSNTYGCDLMIDYNHEVDEAAGWVKSLFLSEDGKELWASVQWTPPGKECLDNKEFRYISADLTFSFQDNESGVQYGPVLFGAALTNRPFVKGMSAAVGLNENHGGTKMDLKELTAQNTQLSEKVKSLESEKASEIKRLSDEKIALETENKKLKEDSEKAKKESDFALLLSEGKAVPAQKDAFMKGDMIEFVKLAGKINLKEKGQGGEEVEEIDPKDEKAKEAKIVKLAEEKVAKDKISMAEALKQVFKENPELK